jgi:hypothetical protein
MHCASPPPRPQARARQLLRPGWCAPCVGLIALFATASVGPHAATSCLSSDPDFFKLGATIPRRSLDGVSPPEGKTLHPRRRTQARAISSSYRAGLSWHSGFKPKCRVRSLLRIRPELHFGRNAQTGRRPKHDGVCRGLLAPSQIEQYCFGLDVTMIVWVGRKPKKNPAKRYSSPSRRKWRSRAWPHPHVERKRINTKLQCHPLPLCSGDGGVHITPAMTTAPL